MISVDKLRNAYRDEDSISARLHERALRVLPGGNTRTTVHLDPYPPYAARGEGAVLIDAEGERRLDFLNNYTSLIHGHADSDVMTAVSSQLSRGSSFGYPTSSEIDLAELIVDRIASIEQVRFTNSGTEAVMMAIHAARAYTGRSTIAVFDGSYHGAYDAVAVGSTAGADGRLKTTASTAGIPAAVIENTFVLRYNDLDGLEQELERNKQHIAAVLVDLMPWRMGLIRIGPAFICRLRELTEAMGILLIADEVITLRVGYGGLQSILGVTPDLTTMGKIIGGGFPVGAVGGRAEIMSVFDPRGGHPKVPHGGTFTANPVTMVSGVTTLAKLTQERLDKLNADGAYVRNALTEAMADAGIPGYITGMGSLFGISLAPTDGEPRDYRSWLGTEQERARRGRIHQRLLRNGVVVAPHLTGCLSTAMTRDNLDDFVDAVRSSLE